MKFLLVDDHPVVLDGLANALQGLADDVVCDRTITAEQALHCLQHTSYELDNVAPGQQADPTRTMPIASLDTGMYFERLLEGSENRILTLEPRVLYVHAPFREQDDHFQTKIS